MTTTRNYLEWIGLQWARKDLRNNQQRVAAVQRRFETFQVYDYYRLRDRIAAGIKKTEVGRKMP